MIETINGKAYLKVGDKVYELGGGSNIIAADSVDELPDPASVPEGTIALVKSEGGGGGLPVVELSTTISPETSFTEAENAALTAAFNSGMPFALKCSLNYTMNDAEIIADSYRTVASTFDVDGQKVICFNYSIQVVTLVYLADTWVLTG